MKKMQKDITGFVGSNMILAAGGSALTGMGGSTAGISAYSNMMPAVATTSAGVGLIRITKGMMPKKRKRRR